MTKYDQTTLQAVATIYPGGYVVRGTPRTITTPDLINATAPRVIGQLGVEATLEADPGTWTPADARIWHEWLVGDDTVVTDTLVPLVEDIGKRVTLIVRADTPDGQYASREIDAGIVPRPVITPGAPVVSGEPYEMVRLTLDKGEWLPAGTEMTATWYVDGEEYTGAWDDELFTQPDMVGRTVTVAVTGTYPGADPVSVWANSTGPLKARAANLVAPRILGTPEVGRTLTADVGTWTPGAQVESYWIVGGEIHHGASLTLTAEMAGQQVMLVVGAGFADGGYTETEVRTGPVKAAPAPPTTPPTIQPAPPTTPPSAPSKKYERTAPYTLAGNHVVNGRQWRTSCEPYSRTERCRSEIWATAVVKEGNSFVRKDGWAFNNLVLFGAPSWR